MYEAGGDSERNASNQHMSRAASPQVEEPGVVISLFRCLVGASGRYYQYCMAECCCPPPLNLDSQRGNGAYRRVLWAVLAINAVMFLVEIGAGLAAGSASLQADALDFLGDAANYAISLFVVGLALRYRAMAALVKGATMAAFGLWVIAMVVWHAVHGTLPSAFAMGTVGIAA